MVLITMDRTGDTRATFDTTDSVAIAAAEARFMELTGKGFVAVVPGAAGAPGVKMKAFDPNVETIVFHPQLMGG
jgi:hypothetical protein